MNLRVTEYWEESQARTPLPKGQNLPRKSWSWKWKSLFSFGSGKAFQNEQWGHKNNSS